ncbi:MAG: TrkH family potassium uptake protein [Paracoccaceae bacterium]
MSTRLTAFSGGTDALAQRARPLVVLLTIAKHAPVFVLLVAPPALWAAVEGEAAFAMALIAPTIIGVGAYLSVRSQPLPSDLRGIEALVTISLVFLLAAVLSVPAFMALGMTPVDALFEAMSGVTTTGLSVASSPDDWPFAAHFFRAWLQWSGGLVMATAVLALLLPSGVPARRLGRAGIDQGDRISSTRRQARQLLGVYVGLTLVMTAATALAIPDWREALALTLSGISTGGFAPRSDSLASYSALGQGLVIVTCCLGAISMLTFVLVLQGKPREAWRLGSARRTVTALALLSVIYTGFLFGEGAGVQELYERLLNLASALTTAGYSTGPVPGAGAALVVFVIAMLWGGDVGSTAGGLKLLRVGLLLRALRHIVRAPALPDRAVAPLRHGGKPVDEATMVSLLGLLSIYCIAALMVWVHFLAHGYEAGPALFDTLSTLSTVGLSTIVGPDLPTDLKLSLTFAMWLGRLEFIAVLIVLLPRTWLKRS